MIKTQCPTCKAEVFTSHLSPKGICMFCYDSMVADIKSRLKLAEGIELNATHFAESVKKRFDGHVRDTIKLKAKKEEAARLKEKKKEVDTVEREQASLALARKSLLHYVERYSPGYDASWAHEDVARRIEAFVGAVARGESPRLILQICSRFGKSLLASDAGPAWILGAHPDWNIVISSYSDELPVKFSKNIRAQLKSPDFRSIFPSGAQLSPDDAGAKAWTTTKGGGLRATGVGGALLGFGAHILIVDDPIKDMEEADSPGALEKVYDWFSSVAYSRLMPGGGILVIQQRMAHEDLVGRLIQRQDEEEARLQSLYDEIEALSSSRPSAAVAQEIEYLEEEAAELNRSMDRWDVATYPALATHDEYLSDEGDIHRIQPGMSPDDSWRLLRRRGEAIHPKRYSRTYYLKLKRANPRRFAAMYQLSPQLDDGEYFAPGMFKRYTPGNHPTKDRAYFFCAWDLAIGTKQSNDHTVGVAGCYDSKGRLWLVDRVRGKFGDIRQISDLVIDMHERWDATQTGIERTHVEMAMGPILKARMRERNAYINLAEGKEALKPISDKKVRARSFQNLAQAGKVYVPEGEDWDDYISIVSRFGATTIDDDVDATAWLAILALRHAPPKDPKEIRKMQAADGHKSWLDEFLEEYASRDQSYMES